MLLIIMYIVENLRKSFNNDSTSGAICTLEAGQGVAGMAQHDIHPKALRSDSLPKIVSLLPRVPAPIVVSHQENRQHSAQSCSHALFANSDTLHVLTPGPPSEALNQLKYPTSYMRLEITSIC